MARTPGTSLSILGSLALALSVGCTSMHTPAAETGRIAQLLELGPGMDVADVGAGDGEWTMEMAAVVGPSGRVYSTEVDEDDLENIREMAEEAGLGNITAILGDQEDTGLPDGCCDGVLLRLVYHHFTDPPLMRASLRRALRPDGLLAVIDLPLRKGWRELPGVPDRGGHGIPVETLIEDMTSDGWVVVRRIDDWDDDEHYCVLFRPPPGS